MARRGTVQKREGEENRSKLGGLIREAAYNHATWEVWQDLMYMSAAAISNRLVYRQEMEDEYLRRIAKYDKKRQAIFPQMFAAIVESLEQEGCKDVLGGIYMELELGNHWKGQYFSPDSICRLMASLQLQESDIEEIKRKGYTSVNDCCCGSGAMLIAFANACQERGIDYQHSVFFEGIDIDSVVAHMCYVQLSLLGMAGRVIIGNTLSLEVTDAFYTPCYFTETWHLRRQYRKFEEIIGKEVSTIEA